jgi:hypothetical protein
MADWLPVCGVRQELEAAQGMMESMTEDHESRIGYELYKVRVGAVVCILFS